jgi:hypothetical protein
LFCTFLPLSWCFGLQKKVNVKKHATERHRKGSRERVKHTTGALLGGQKRINMALSQDDSPW